MRSGWNGSKSSSFSPTPQSRRRHTLPTAPLARRPGRRKQAEPQVRVITGDAGFGNHRGDVRMVVLHARNGGADEPE